MLQYTLPGQQKSDSKSSNFVHTSLNWLIGVTYKFWGIIIKILSWLDDNELRPEAGQQLWKLYEIARFITSAFNT